MASKIDICNMALGKIGAAQIQSLDEKSAEARACKQFYDHARRYVLEAHAWDFATRTAALAKLDGFADPRGAFPYAYPLPANTLRVLRVLPDKAPGAPSRYELRGKLLLCDLEAATLLDVWDFEDCAAFPASFTEALSCYLAYSVVAAIKASAEQQQGLYQLFRLALAQAGSVDAGQRNVRKPFVSIAASRR